MNALAPIAVASARLLPFASDATAIGAAIIALESCYRPCREMDAEIYRALGWTVEFDRHRPRRGWRCRSPISSWQPLPAPTCDRHAAAHLVPHGWSYGSGCRSVPFAWTAGAWPVREGVPFFEASGLSDPLALCRAALFAHRWLASRRSHAA